MNNLQKNSDPNSVDTVLRELFSFHRFGIKPGLENIAVLLEHLGNPHRRFPCIHVAGTNGKGTTCSAIASVLTEAGYTVGLYTSPHILRFNERIRINGREIDDADIARLAERIMPETRRIQGTFFEVTTAMALAYFAENNVDIAVLETGMGGRLDSTNVVTPLLSVITSIDLEHTHFLGTTLPEIAAEKAGIIKPHVPVLVGEPREELRPVFTGKARREDAPIVFLDDICTIERGTGTASLAMTLSLATPAARYDDLRLPLAGGHAARNVALGVVALELIGDGLTVTPEHVRTGIESLRRNTGLRGRLELLADDPPVVLDVAHNHAGVQALAETLAWCGLADRRWTVVVAVMEDKAVDAMLEALKPLTSTLIATSPAVDRALSAEGLAAKASAHGFATVCTFPVVAGAVETALQLGEPVLIVGSFYLADEALAYWNERTGTGGR